MIEQVPPAEPPRPSVRRYLRPGMLRPVRLIAIPLLVVAVVLVMSMSEIDTGTDLIGFMLQVALVAAFAAVVAVFLERGW